jgi:LPXTG-site transpeptidase (sortase) family protein
MRLWIPGIGVDAPIQYQGLTADGSLDAPDDMKVVSWYSSGPHPGDQGSAVIDGHRGVGEYGIFQDLHKLAVGDVVLVHDDQEHTIVFVVREIHVYGPPGAHLNLITCDGTYEKKHGGTPNRLVIFTDKIN